MIPLGGCQRICGMDTLRRRGCPGRAWFPCRAWTELLFGGSIYEVNMRRMRLALPKIHLHPYRFVWKWEIPQIIPKSTEWHATWRPGWGMRTPEGPWRLEVGLLDGTHIYFSGLFLSVCVGKAPFFFGPVGKPTPRCSIHPWNTRDDRWETGMDQDGIDSP